MVLGISPTIVRFFFFEIAINQRKKVTILMACIKVEEANASIILKKSFRQCSESSLLVSAVLIYSVKPKSEKTGA